MEKKDVAMLLILFLFLGTSLYIAKNLGNNRITGYSVFSGNPAGGMNLTISDETDSAEKYDSEQIRFFANLTNSTDGAVIDNTSANVSIYFPDLGIYDMTFNSTSQLWEFNITFGLNGTFLYNITGNSSLYAPTVVIAQDSFFLLPLIAVNNSGALFSSLVQCLTVNDGALARCTVTRENYKETINGTYIFYNTTIDMDENNITIDCNNSQWIASNQSGWYWVDHPGGNSNLTLTNCIVSNYNVGFATSTFTSENWSVINMTIRNTTLYAMALNGIDGMLIQGMNAEGTI